MVYVPKISLQNDVATIKSWGIVDDMVLHEGDTLIVEQRTESGLVILKPNGFGNCQFGRLVNGQTILLPQGRSVTKRCWNIVGSVKGISRPLGNATLGRGDWYVQFYNMGPNTPLNWLALFQNIPINSTYLSELTLKLMKIDPEISIIATQSNNRQSMVVPRPGQIVFLFEDSEPCLKYVPKWAIGNRLRRRNLWQMKRRRDVSIELYPIPDMHFRHEYDRLASK